MALAEVLGILPGVTAVVGSGGKTTLLAALGREIAAQGRRAVLCTTTRIYPFPGLPLIAGDAAALSRALAESRLVCAGTPCGGGKLAAPAIAMEKLAGLADYVFVEADGAAGRPLKAHAPHEPVIPPEAGRVICVVGLTGLGQPVARAAHRPARYAALSGAAEDDPVTPELAARVLNAEALGDLYFCNQWDAPGGRESAARLAALLRRRTAAGAAMRGEAFLC